MVGAGRRHQLNCELAPLPVLRREDVLCSFVRQKNVHEKFSLYGVPFCREMSACKCSFVQMVCAALPEVRYVLLSTV